MFAWLDKYRQRTITRDIILGLVLTIFVVTVAVAMISYALILDVVRTNLETEASASTERLAGVLAVPLWNVDMQTVKQSAEVFLQTADVVGVTVWDEGGRIGFQDSTTAVENEEVEANYIIEERPIFFAGQNIGQVQVIYSTEAIARASQYLISTTTAVLLVVLVAVIIVTQTLLNRYLTTPLENLTNSLDFIASGSYEHRIPPAKQVDINKIGRRANIMAEQIEVRDKELRQLVDTLEQQVAARTARLETVAVVGGYLNAILKVDELLQALVEQVQERFDYAHVIVFLLDKERKNLQVAAATGTILTQLGDEGFQIPLDAPISLVARAAREKQVIKVDDVASAPDWLSHDLLDNTRSEMVVPILLDGESVGVLDVQQNQIGVLDEGDANLLRSLASQVAIAIRNAQLYEEALAARRRAEYLSKMKTEFLSNMSHELRTPLNAIINFNGFVLDGLMGEINEKQREFLQFTLDNSHHLLSLVNDILDLSKIEAGFMSLIFEDINMTKLLTDIVSTTHSLAKDKPLQIHGRVPHNLPEVHGDQRRLRQIFLNIVSNAVKYTEKGHISITAEYQEETSCIHVAVQDTGCGISPEDISRIFQPFEQAQHSLGSLNSTGLGLPITRQLLTLHGGEIWAESELNQGSIFHITIPLQPSGQDGIVHLQDYASIPTNNPDTSGL